MALAAENTVGEFFGLIPQTSFAQRPRRNADKVKNVTVLTDQWAERLFNIQILFFVHTFPSV